MIIEQHQCDSPHKLGNCSHRELVRMLGEGGYARYDESTATRLLKLCIKLNDEELDEIAAAMGSRYNSLEQNVAFISETTNTPIVCVTKGRHGALLKIGDRTYYNSGYAVDVVDTVGAGDSFLASLIYQLCCTDNAQYAIDFACAVSAMVAQNRGATPELSCDDIDRFMHPGKYQD